MIAVGIIVACLASGYLGFWLGSLRQRVFILTESSGGDEREYCPWIG